MYVSTITNAHTVKEIVTTTNHLIVMILMDIMEGTTVTVQAHKVDFENTTHETELVASSATTLIIAMNVPVHQAAFTLGTDSHAGTMNIHALTRLYATIKCIGCCSSHILLRIVNVFLHCKQSRWIWWIEASWRTKPDWWPSFIQANYYQALDTQKRLISTINQIMMKNTKKFRW